MFCPQCGQKCPDDSRFCENCGSPIDPVPHNQGGYSAVPAGDPLAAAVSEIEANVKRAQVAAPAPAPAQSWPVAPPMPAKKKFPVGIVVALVVVMVLLAAAGGGAFYLFHMRAVNEANLTENLAQYVWDYCEKDVIDYYDDALSKPYNKQGYKVEREESSFSLQPSQEKDIFRVWGRVDIIDRTEDDASYQVDISGTVKTNFLRTKYIWDLQYDFEEPPEPAQEPDPDVEPEQSGTDDTPAQQPAPSAPGTAVTPGAAGSTPGSAGNANQSGYLWPTDTQYITNADLDNFERKQIMLMRNELYARYGCSFQDEEIRTYFLSQSWYNPNPDLLAVNFSVELFNSYERANLDTILNYERSKGWRK